ncbi:MAG: hypothetical protein OIF50_02170 [Flavobacteriaceae bacterium]|nr:hypothetical protein [Flavobacteriaceae bacterium]
MKTVLKAKMWSILWLFLLACSGNDKDDLYKTDALDTRLDGRTTNMESIVAVASSDPDKANGVKILFYPKSGATDFRLYYQVEADKDSLDYAAYRLVKDSTIAALYTGFYQEFQIDSLAPHWAIVTFEHQKILHTSPPIRLQHIENQTRTSNTVSIDHSIAASPRFRWDSISPNNKFLYLISDENPHIQSSGISSDRSYTYGNQNNVVLDLNESPAPTLVKNKLYTFKVFELTPNNWTTRLLTANFEAQ